MTGLYLINALAVLLGICSMGVILPHRALLSLISYIAQTCLLIAVFLVMAFCRDMHELNAWAVSAFISKVVIVAGILYVSQKRLGSSTDNISFIGKPWLIAGTAIIFALSCLMASPIKLPAVSGLELATGFAFGTFFMGIFCIVTSRNLFKQVFGYCLMENGSHLALALLAAAMPESVEIAIAADTVLTVFVLTILIRKIHHQSKQLDIQSVSALKG